MSNAFTRAAITGGRIRASREARSSFASSTADIAAQVKEVIKTMQTLPKEFQSKATKKALRKGANILRDAAKQNAPVDEGDLRDSIKTFSLRKSKMALFVGPRFLRVSKGGKKSYANYYGGFVEFGTRNMAGKGYMRKAFDSGKAEAIAQIEKDTLAVVKNWIEKNKV